MTHSISRFLYIVNHIAGTTWKLHTKIFLQYLTPADATSKNQLVLGPCLCTSLMMKHAKK